MVGKRTEYRVQIYAIYPERGDIRKLFGNAVKIAAEMGIVRECFAVPARIFGNAVFPIIVIRRIRPFRHFAGAEKPVREYLVHRTAGEPFRYGIFAAVYKQLRFVYEAVGSKAFSAFEISVIPSPCRNEFEMKEVKPTRIAKFAGFQRKGAAKPAGRVFELHGA